jgi:hypothetical protein
MTSNKRDFIIKTYAAWTVLSALRSGSPVKSRGDVYPLVQSVDFDQVLTGSNSIDAEEFNQWHRQATQTLCKKNERLCVGWAAKIINVYLKTGVYIGDLGRPNLRDVIHPPIDGGLWAGLKEHFKHSHPEIISLTMPKKVQHIKAIINYDIYSSIIRGCRLAAKELDCTLIEVEQLWDASNS